MPLIALFNGMRLNEICQLDVGDIEEVEGVACLHVRSDPFANSGKRLKTESSERLIPVHPTLLAIGFMSFVAGQRAKGAVRLFPELRRSTTGYYSDPFSKWFRRFLTSVGATAPRTCFHSFRHSFRDALRQAKVEHEISLALGGWSVGGGAGNVTASAYGKGRPMTDLATAVAAISFKSLDLSHIASTDDNEG